VSEPDEEQEQERNRREERVEGERARKEGNVGLVGRLESTAEKAGG
jgi:hypothetical protein